MKMKNMKFNGTPNQYAPLPQTHSDDEIVQSSKSQDSSFLTPNGTSSMPSAPLQLKKYEDEESEPMSPLRKVCFILSLLLAVLFIVAFGWFIPCRFGALEYSSIPVIAQEWKYVLTGLISTSNIQAAFLDGKEDEAIYFGFMNLNNESQPTTGVLAVQGKTGTELWRKSLYKPVKHQICFEGACYVTGEGMFAALNESTGEVQWYMHNHDFDEQTTIHETSLPVLVDDCDGDGVVDFVISILVNFSGSSDEHGHQLIRFVSGSTGQLTGSLVNISMCADIVSDLTEIKHQNGRDILFYCPLKTKKGAVFKVSLQDLCRSHTNSSEISPQILLELDKLSNIRKPWIVPLPREDIFISSIVIGWGFGQLVKLSGTNYKTDWKVNLRLHSEIRGLLAGHFMAYTAPALFLVSDYFSQASLLELISVENGKSLWKMQYNNATVSTATVVPKVSNYVDGVLIKALATFQTAASEKNQWKNVLSKEGKSAFLNNFPKVKVANVKGLKVQTTTYEEQYLLVDFTNQTVQLVASLMSSQVCISKEMCHPTNSVLRSNNAAMLVPNNKNEHVLVVASLTANHMSSSPLLTDTSVQVVHFTYHTSCCNS